MQAVVIVDRNRKILYQKVKDNLQDDLYLRLMTLILSNVQVDKDHMRLHDRDFNIYATCLAFQFKMFIVLENEQALKDAKEITKSWIQYCKNPLINVYSQQYVGDFDEIVSKYITE